MTPKRLRALLAYAIATRDHDLTALLITTCALATLSDPHLANQPQETKAATLSTLALNALQPARART